MRRGMHLVVLLLVIALLLTTLPAGGQGTVDRPTYTRGDFWAYDLTLLAPVEFPNNTSATFTLTGNTSVTIEGSEERTIGGEARTVYNSTGKVRASADGDLSFTFFNETTNATFTASLSVDETVYLDPNGLEALERRTTFAADIELGIDAGGGVTVSVTFAANGSAELTTDYTFNAWDFPITVGNVGEERFNATGQSFVQLIAGGNTTSSSAPIYLNGTNAYEAVREETVTVPAGTFSTVVVASTPAQTGMPVTNASVLAYWSGAVGAPVRYAFTNETEVEVAELVLTGHSYQFNSALTILGVDALLLLPILVGIAILAIILAIVLGRRRRTEPPPPP